MSVHRANLDFASRLRIGYRLSMARLKLKTPVYRLRTDNRGVWIVSWTDPDTGLTRKRSCLTTDKSVAEKLMPVIIAELARPDPVKVALAKLTKPRR